MKPTSLLIALPLGLLFAGAAVAQQPTTQSQDQTTTQAQQRSQDMQMQRDRAARSDSTMQQDQKTPAARNAAGNEQTRSAHMTFDQLDSQHHGYLMRTDVSRDAWLASHFSQCDTNSDAQLSRSEYDACRR